MLELIAAIVPARRREKFGAFAAAGR